MYFLLSYGDIKGNAQPWTKRHESFSGETNKNVQKRVKLEISFFELFKVILVGLINIAVKGFPKFVSTF